MLRAIKVLTCAIIRTPNPDCKGGDSLERIIDYLFWDEIRDWEAQGKPRKHIFTDVRRVDRWLEEMTEKKRASDNAR